MSERSRFVTEDQVSRAVEFLRDSAKELGEAKARAVKASHMVKHIEALQSKASDEKSAEGRKADARTTPEYIDAINEDAFAQGDLSKLYALREAAGQVIEVWRTQESNIRALKI